MKRIGSLVVGILWLAVAAFFLVVLIESFKSGRVSVRSITRLVRGGRGETVEHMNNGERADKIKVERLGDIKVDNIEVERIDGTGSTDLARTADRNGEANNARNLDRSRRDFDDYDDRDDFSHSRGFGEVPLKSEDRFAAHNINNIETVLSSESLIIEETNSPDYTVRIFSTRNKKEIPEVSCSDGKLTVASKRRSIINFVGMFERTRVVIGVPRGNIGELGINAKASSGSIQIDEVDAHNITLKNSSGSIKLDSVGADIIVAQNTSGSIKLEEVRANDLDCANTSGSIKGEEVAAEKFSAKSTSGSVKIEELRATEAFAETSSGSVKIEESAIGFVTAKATSGGVTLNGRFDGAAAETLSGSVHMTNAAPLTRDSTFKATAGSVRLALAENDGFTLNYSTVSGGARNDFTGLSGKGTGKDVYKNGGVAISAKTTSGSVGISRN